MNNLDDPNYIKKLDEKQCLASVDLLAAQCKSAWDDAITLIYPSSYKNFSNIVFCGMGGSSYAGRIIKSLFKDELPCPLDIINDYDMPAYVNENSLVIAASYSGSTEESLSCLSQALKVNAKVAGICQKGGKIEEILNDRKLPVFVFTPKDNPSMQPRLGQGYMQMGQIAILTKLNLLKIDTKEIYEVIDSLKKNTCWNQSIPFEKNQAKQYAQAMIDKIVEIVGGGFLEGAIHSIRNPIHETGKHMADYFILPELNHHLMEGLANPVSNKDNLIFFMINSGFYSGKIAKRFGLTKEIISKNNIEIKELELKFPTKIGQVFELIQFGSYLSFYMGILHGIDPSKIPWVDYFKKNLD